MWPRRKIRLVTTASSGGLGGVQTLLEALKIEYDLCGWSEEFTEEFNTKFTEEHSEFQDVYITEGVFWPEVPETEIRSEGPIKGCLKKQTIQDYLHKLWEGEILIPVSESGVLWNDRPLLWEVLQEAGFEPSLLWQNGEEWMGERGRGMIWIVPSSWLKLVAGETFMGRPRILISELTAWRIREQQVDFYTGQDCYKFIGFLPRWPELAFEQAVYETICLALNLGISWFDIKQVIIRIRKNGLCELPRCDNEDSGQFAGTQGEQLSFTGFDDLENRRTG